MDLITLASVSFLVGGVFGGMVGWVLCVRAYRKDAEKQAAADQAARALNEALRRRNVIGRNLAEQLDLLIRGAGYYVDHRPVEIRLPGGGWTQNVDSPYAINIHSRRLLACGTVVRMLLQLQKPGEHLVIEGLYRDDSGRKVDKVFGEVKEANAKGIGTRVAQDFLATLEPA